MPSQEFVLVELYCCPNIKKANSILIKDNINTKEPNAKMMFLVNTLKSDMDRELGTETEGHLLPSVSVP